MDIFTVVTVAYTVTVADNRKTVLVKDPKAIITLASPALYPNKFCVNIANRNFVSAVKVRSAQIGDAIEVFPNQKTPFTLTANGTWSTKDRCD